MIRRDFFDGDFGFDALSGRDIDNGGLEEFRQSDDGFSDGNPINGGGSGGFTSAPRPVRGCTDRNATNYNARATQDDGSCIYRRPIEEPVIRVKRGCTDPTAINYDSSATSDNGTCRYKEVTPTPIYNDFNAQVRINITANQRGAIYVDGKDISKSTSTTLSFTEKELLTPKVFTVKRSNYTSIDEFRVRSVKRTFKQTIKPLFEFEDDLVPNDEFPDEGFSVGPGREFNDLDRDRNFGRQTSRPTQPEFIRRRTRRVKRAAQSISTSYYDTIVEKKVNGNYVQQNVQKPGDLTNVSFLKSRLVNLSLNFNLNAIKIDDDKEEEIEVTKGDTKYVVYMQGDLPNSETLQYRTNYGQIAFLRDDDEPTSIAIEQSEGQTQPYIEFIGQGISDYTHEMIVEYQSTGKNEKKKSVEQKFELEPGRNDFKIVITKKPVKDGPTTPSISVKQSSLKFNIASDDSIGISYDSSNADYVNYTLGKTKRRISTSGTVRLKKSDFSNGLGRYTVYLQPVSSRGGSGDTAKIIINVGSKEYLPGPDIRTINYPQNIEGADFKGFDVDFNISWQSINTNYIIIYAGKVSNSTILGRFPNNGAATFNVERVLRKLRDKGRADVVQIPLKLVPYNEEGNQKTAGKTEEINITFDKGDLTLRRARVVSDIKKAFTSQFDTSGFDEFISPFLSHYLHIGGGDNKLIGTWGIDEETLSTYEIDEDTNRRKLVGDKVKALVLKLYEPLPRNINTNDKVWISKVQSLPLVDQITIIDDVVKDCTPLLPNFNLDVGDDVGYQILDDLITSGSTSSAEVVQEFVSSSEFSLDNLYINFVTQSSIVNESGLVVSDGVDTYNWDEFVKYSSAQERVENFFYKVKLIQSYESKYELLTSGSSGASWTGSVAVSNEANKQQIKIREVKRGFDAFEKFLYTSSSLSGLTYPGAGLNELSASTDSSVTTWYNTILNSSIDYDSNNTSKLTNNLPEHIILDKNNNEFTLFFDMIGQHFDVLYTHIKGLSRNKKLEHKHSTGINNNLIYHMLESLGWDADMGVSSQFLWEYAFGKHSDGTVISEMSGKDRQNEIWRRILNNLPYLYKHKGTKRALHAALSCYGVPASALTIMEFSGPKDRTTVGTVPFTFEDRTASINISGSAAITIPWNEYSGTSDYPNSVEIRLNSQERQDQELISGSQWSLHLLKDTGSLAKVELRVMSGSTLVSSSTDTGAFFNDEYTQIVVNKEVSGSSDVFTFYAKESFQDRLRTNLSGSLVVSGVSGWTSGSELKIGGNNLTASVDEFRLWTTPLSESKVDNHTQMPDAIDGNHVSASSQDLLFRLDFEYPKNRHSSGDTSIKNVSIVRDYATYATASNFENITSYPYQYVSYERTVTAQVPQTGFSMANKVRLESQTKISDLSYRSRATKKSFDQAPLDTDQLGLFFSPIKEINMDILKSIGSFNIDDYIGDPSDEYRDEYKKLKDLRNYYFDRYTLDFNQYIQLVKYFDKSLFTTLESLVPARAKVSSGLLIQPHMLERSKVAWKETTSEKLNYEGGITYGTEQEGENPQYLTVISASEDTNLAGTNPQYLGSITTEDTVTLTGINNQFSASIVSDDTTSLSGTITRNSGSTMGGIEFTIDATSLGASIQGQHFTAKSHQTIGMEPDSLSVAGFGLFGSGSHAIRTFYDKSGNVKKERVKVFLVKEQFTEKIPENIDSNDSSKGTQLVSNTKNRFKVSILPFTGSDGNESSTPSGGNIVSATPLNGYFSSHYRNTGDLTSGLENSFFNGSKQTSATTTDGGSPVQTFTTNPNTLKVSDSGRGSGEPILEVE